MKLEFSQQLLKKKYSNIKLYENPSRGRRVVPCGQTDGQQDRHDEANSRFFLLQFWERAKKKQHTQASKNSIFLKLISLRPIYYIHISSSTPYSQTQSASFHVNDSSKFHSTTKAKTTASNICFFLTGRQNIVNWVSASILQINLSVTSLFIKVIFNSYRNSQRV